MNEHLPPIFKQVLDQAVKDLTGYVKHREEKMQRKMGPSFVPNKVIRDLAELAETEPDRFDPLADPVRSICGDSPPDSPQSK
jgi:hypothetical protein